MSDHESTEAGERTQHTPGPWKVHPTSPRKVVDEIGTVIASCGRVEKVPDYVYKGYLVNARLIAAAPELLEACKDFLNQASGWDDSYCELCDRHAPKDRDGNIVNDVPHRDDCAVRLAHAAIAKAEGRTS